VAADPVGGHDPPVPVPRLWACVAPGLPPGSAPRAKQVRRRGDRPGTSNGPTEAINGRLEHLRGSALGFRNLTNYIAGSLLESGGSDPDYTPDCDESRLLRWRALWALGAAAPPEHQVSLLPRRYFSHRKNPPDRRQVRVGGPLLAIPIRRRVPSTSALSLLPDAEILNLVSKLFEPVASLGALGVGHAPGLHVKDRGRLAVVEVSGRHIL
jgi:Transposase